MTIEEAIMYLIKQLALKIFVVKEIKNNDNRRRNSVLDSTVQRSKEEQSNS